jgi:hypothetical protein
MSDLGLGRINRAAAANLPKALYLYPHAPPMPPHGGLQYSPL